MPARACPWRNLARQISSFRTCEGEGARLQDWFRSLGFCLLFWILGLRALAFCAAQSGLRTCMYVCVCEGLAQGSGPLGHRAARHKVPPCRRPRELIGSIRGLPCFRPKWAQAWDQGLVPGSCFRLDVASSPFRPRSLTSRPWALRPSHSRPHALRA